MLVGKNSTDMKSILYIFIIACLFSCSKSGDSSPAGSGSGKAGSLARFAIVGDNLYTVTTTELKIFDIKDESNPVYQGDMQAGIDIETIFPLGNTLFMGSEVGMYMYDVTDPLSPKRLSIYQHIRSCDPVVANDKHAFVTLSTSATRCSRGVNQLEVIDIANKNNPRLLKTLVMNRPLGMALDGNNLFVCDDVVKWFDVSNSPNLTSKGTINVKARDAIVHGNTLMLVGEKGLTQYDISTAQPKFLSQINIGKL